MKKWRSLAVVCLGAQTWTSSAAALQPLSTFVDGAHQQNPELQEAQANQAQQRSQEKAATWRLLPTFSATGSYTRNQYERELQLPGETSPRAIIARDQLDAALVLSVPIVNVAAWESMAASDAMSDYAEASTEAVKDDLERRVVRAYYQLLASSAVAQAAQKNLELAQANLKLVVERRNNGAATELDVQRAEADVARIEQDLANAQLGEKIASRALFSLSGVQPSAAVEFPQDDLSHEKSLEEWNEQAQSAPALVAASAAERAARKQSDAARAAWYPALMGTAQERFTNATALVGHGAYYSLQLSLSWKFDGSNLHLPDAQQAAAQAAVARAHQRKQVVEDGVYQAYQQVEIGIVRAGAARRQAAAAAKAVELAQQQYREGMTTQLEVLAAQQSAFYADVARIQADADLAYARAALRILTSQADESSSSSSGQH